MQIVIDIPECYYEYCKAQEDAVEIQLAVKNGTPLPKGHGDLIDANRKITVSTYDEQYEEWGEETLTVRDALNRWADDGVTVKDVIIPADTEGEDGYHD